ncbi:UV DNA damage repair endonuclease UvsE [Pradoshia sp.]
MTYIRLGYVAMSTELQNASPSQTMTYAQFSKLKDREAALRKLERIAQANLHNCLRLLKHNEANGIEFFRFSSKLIPLADHPELSDWSYMQGVKQETAAIMTYLREHKQVRVDFHPDHFIVLNSPDKEVLKSSVKALTFHYRMLKAMGIPPKHRCVLHVGGSYNDKEQALEQFISNWAQVPVPIQEMVILENDDTLFGVDDVLYLCEKLGIPFVFDLHHHKMNPQGDFGEKWERIVGTWEHSQLPIKVHLSSPKNEKNPKAHADYVEVGEIIELLKGNRGYAAQIDVMLEAKLKDAAVFRMAEELKHAHGFKQVNGACFQFNLSSH